MNTGFGVLIETLDYDEPYVDFYASYDKLIEAYKEKRKELRRNEDYNSVLYMKWADERNENWPCGMFQTASYIYSENNTEDDESSLENEDPTEDESDDDEEYSTSSSD